VGKYIGLFDRSATYSYASGKFSSGATMPGSCTYLAGTYLCVNTTMTGTVESVTDFVASGNFLNWLTMSKFDIEKQILTGGKYDATNHLLQAETRGCSGRKFVKTVPGLTSLTFALRGGNTTGIERITSQATEFGQTHLEIYKGQYNAAACAASLNDWMNVNSTQLGTLQVDTKCCLTPGTATGVCNPTSTLDVANQSIHDCFWYFNGHGLSNMQPIQNNCVNDWGIISAASITLPSAPDAICSSVLPHDDSLVWSSGSTQTSNGEDAYNTGYLGLCYNHETGFWDAAGGFNANCSVNEQKDYCAGLGGTGSVTTLRQASRRIASERTRLCHGIGLLL
jgi:type IV pilus assembly protein PilY1